MANTMNNTTEVAIQSRDISEWLGSKSNVPYH